MLIEDITLNQDRKIVRIKVHAIKISDSDIQAKAAADLLAQNPDLARVVDVSTGHLLESGRPAFVCRHY